MNGSIHTVLKLRVKQVIHESKIRDKIHDTRQHKKAKSTRQSARDLQNLHILPETLVEGLKSRRGHYWNYVVSAFENTPKNLVVHGRAQLEYSSHIVKVGIEATSLHFNP